MRVLFAGTPAIAVPSLRSVASAHEVVAVLTTPDRPAGRGGRMRPSRVKEEAIALGLPLLEAERLEPSVCGRVAALHPEILVAVAFGRIFRQAFLDLFPRGGLNLHPSLLPRHRGPSPVAAAILSGDAETGVTVQRIALAVDAGDILAQARVPLDGTETTGSLSERLGTVGAGLLVEVLGAVASGSATATPQLDAEATWSRRISREDGMVDWRQPAAAIERAVRAFDPWPRASTTWKGKLLLLLNSRLPPATVAGGGVEPEPGTVIGGSPHGLLVQAGDRPLAIGRLQLAFRKPLDWQAFLNGNRGIVGERLGG